jgi:hypothetical protein
MLARESNARPALAVIGSRHGCVPCGARADLLVQHLHRYIEKLCGPVAGGERLRKHGSDGLPFLNRSCR